MGHNVETMYSRDTGNPSDVPWHFLIKGGTDESQTKITAAPKTKKELLEVSQTDWQVIQQPVFTLSVDGMAKLEAGQYTDELPAADLLQFDGDEGRPEYWANMRDRDSQLLGIVGSRMEPLQNEEQAEFMLALLDTEEFVWETGGSLREGQMVWFMAKLLNPPKLPAGEELASFISTVNYHNGKGSFMAMNHDIRIVCNNTLDAALSSHKSQWAIRHTANMKERTKEAQKALRLARSNAESLVETANELVLRPFKHSDMVDVLGVLYPIPPDSSPLTQKRIHERTDEVMEVWASSPNLENIRDTAWGAFNALVEFADHSPTNNFRSNEARLLSVMTPNGKGHQFKRRALATVANKADVELSVLA